MRFWPKMKPVGEIRPVAQEAVKGDFDVAMTQEQFLDAVDFKTLNDIFDTLVAKSHGEEGVNSTGYKIERARITFHENIFTKLEDMELTTRGQADVETGKILITWDEKDSREHKLKNLDYLHALVHEATHIRSGFVAGELNGNSSVKAGRSGLLESYSEDEHEYFLSFGTSLNEAITENLSHEVLSEYLLRTGNATYIKNPTLLNSISGGVYHTDRILFSVIVMSLSEALSVSRDEIWKGFVQAYMSGNQSVLELLGRIKLELSKSEEIAEMVTLLSSDTSLHGYVSTNAIYKVLDTNVKRYEVYSKVSEPFDKKYLQNVLGIR